MKGKGVFLHESDHWATPKKLYNYFINNGFIDPCPLHSKEDNLEKIYEGQSLFINPPYSQIAKWTEFIRRNINHAHEIFLLIPARTDTKYFHDLLMLWPRPEVIFIKGRLHFNEAGSAPFPSIMLHFYKHRTMSIPRKYSILNEAILK